MKMIASIILTALLAYVCGLFTSIPWFSFALTSFIVAMAIHQKPGKSFLSGFLGVSLLWIVLAYLKDIVNEHILASKVAEILPLGGSYIAVILVTGLVGGLVSGLAAMTASFTRKG
ncbi:MAG: hypothetical protein Q8K64_00410 [Sediminibacterium sp.]|nr:MAG: hypothetical protein FD183_1596 [Chitinophagaceae bacterium]MDP1841848.1 hypothetical protein [Sediminibacterium sp.]